jgi:shikimate dehydrogenase
MNEFGLIGFPLTASFSAEYFKQKFEQLGISNTHRYQLFQLNAIAKLNELLINNPNIKGLNITIPYKQQVLKYIDELDESAAAIGAVNCLRISGSFPHCHITGFNTDAWGFEQSLLAWLPTVTQHKALILGTGGSAKAVLHVLNKLKISWLQVSRQPDANQIDYKSISENILNEYTLVINTTPLGMHPNINEMAPLPVDWLGPQHCVYDLIYNPAETKLLVEAKQRGANTLNGLHMLHLQADRSWQIWSGKI